MVCIKSAPGAEPFRGRALCQEKRSRNPGAARLLDHLSSYETGSFLSHISPLGRRFVSSIEAFMDFALPGAMTGRPKLIRLLAPEFPGFRL